MSQSRRDKLEFTPITESEFQDIRWRGPRGAASSELGDNIRNLEPNTGFSTPCVWKHSTGQAHRSIKKDGTRTSYSDNRCLGVNAAHNRKVSLNKLNNENRHIRCRCADGTLYVFRVA